jgi:hypothetical protein
MIKRSLQEIQSDIQSHKEAIKVLEQEVKDFREACPHPTNFQKIIRKSHNDEYGRTDSYSVTTTCLLCGHSKFETEDTPVSRFL